MVSIPMLRAEIHHPDAKKPLLQDVSIPMLRAGIHQEDGERISD